MPYSTPEEMLKNFVKDKRRDFLKNTLNKKPEGEVIFSFNTSLQPQMTNWGKIQILRETEQTPRAWNLVTVKRCLVTREEFVHFGSIEAVLQAKDFPTAVPDNGHILLSWFDHSTQTAYYELARVQDKKELIEYVREQFKSADKENGVERKINFD